jgi:predicted patatin/cPLA2 family phospholipase
MKIILWKYPKLVQAMARRHKVYNEETADVFAKADSGQVFVICPDQSLGISRTEKNPDELQRVYEQGRQAAQKVLQELKKFLNR